MLLRSSELRLPYTTGRQIVGQSSFSNDYITMLKIEKLQSAALYNTLFCPLHPGSEIL